MAAALRILGRRPAAPPSPMLRSLFAASYSQAAGSVPAVFPSLRRHYSREVTPKVEKRCCNTVPNTKSDSTKSLLDELKDLKDSKKSLEDKAKNIEEWTEMIEKVLSSSENLADKFTKRVNDMDKLIDILRKRPDEAVRVSAMSCKVMDEHKKDLAINESWKSFREELVRMLRGEMDNYREAQRRHQELQRSVLKKVAKVCAAIGLGGGLLLILTKM